MKTHIKSIVAITFLVIAMFETNAAVLTNFVIGVSPFYPLATSPDIEFNVKKFVLDAPKGSHIRIDDAFNLKTIADIAVPNLNYDTPANRMRSLAPVFAKLSQWFTQTRTNAASSELSNSALLHAPEFLDFVAGSGGSAPCGILLMGSPFARYESEPTFSMTGGDEGPRVPSDGHLGASIQATPYGTAERKGKLLGAQISWCYGSDSIWSNGLAKTLTMRFWGLFAKQQDATLVSFTPDVATAFARLPKFGLPAVGNFVLNLDDTKVEMRVARPRQIPIWLPQAVAAPPASVALTQSQPADNLTPARVATATQQQAARPVETPALTLDLARPIAASVDIGIAWQSNDSALDVDLYIRARPGAEEIWFEKTHTLDGVLIKDWTQPNGQTDFEWVKLNPGIRLSEIEAWVNLYRGHGPISGRVAVHFENRTFLGSFTIPAASGNGGLNSRARQSDSHWTRLDLQKILTQPQ